MEKGINSLLKQALQKITPSKEEVNFINKSLKDFLIELKREIKNKQVDVEVFVGGSAAKNTFIKKNIYDVDIFLRFDAAYEDEELSELTNKILNKFKEVKRIHGSRDYFQIQISPQLIFEIVPVLKIKKPMQSRNVTDLSYLHVKYLDKKIKNKKILDEIKLAKAFCQANNCYGAESYISGFSGYGLELLVCYYGGFLKMLKSLSKVEDKLLIDIEKQYKNKQEIMINLNTSKLNSPIIIIDPTYKERNALAALSEETFKRFQKASQDFLKKPSMQFFEKKSVDFAQLQKIAQKKKTDYLLLEISTHRQEGDIAGSKLLKFSRYLESEIERFFKIESKQFEYSRGNSARFFISVKPKQFILFNGPETTDKKNSEKFRKEHKKFYEKKGRLYAEEKINFDLKGFVEKLKDKKSHQIKYMDIISLKII